MTADEEEIEQEEEEGIERAREDVGVGDEASSNDDQTTLSPCHICLDHFRVGEEISWSNVSKCEHCFHSQCINEWLLKHQACPLCRANMLDLTSLQRRDSEEGREDDDSSNVQDEVADVQVEITPGLDTSCNPLPANEENLVAAEEGEAKSINVDATENRQEEALGERMCFCVEHGLRVKMTKQNINGNNAVQYKEMHFEEVNLNRSLLYYDFLFRRQQRIRGGASKGNRNYNQL